MSQAAMLGTALAFVLMLIVLGSAGTRRLFPPRRPESCGEHHDSLHRADVAPHRAIARFDDMRRRTKQRRVERATVAPDAVADWCDALARALRAGTTLRAALAATAPSDATLAHRLAGLRRALDRGETVAAAVMSLDRDEASRRRPSSSHLALASAVLATSGNVGGPAAESLNRLAAALRLRVADGQERAAHSAQARLSAHVLTVVPLALLGLLTGVDVEVRTVLSSGAGFGLLTLGLSLNVGGWFWMRRIIGAGR